jgi:hypothetical protein
MTWAFVSGWHVGVAAEAIATALFALVVQYGANQPEYDLMIAKGDRLLKVSVKGSQDGSWGLCQSYLKLGTPIITMPLTAGLNATNQVPRFASFSFVVLILLICLGFI